MNGLFECQKCRVAFHEDDPQPDRGEITRCSVPGCNIVFKHTVTGPMKARMVLISNEEKEQ